MPQQYIVFESRAVESKIGGPIADRLRRQDALFVADSVQNASDLFLDVGIDLEPCEDFRMVFGQVLNHGDAIKRGPVGLAIENPIAKGILMRPARARITI